MLLTRQQEFLLEVLKRLGCARPAQLAILLHRKFSLGSLNAAERMARAALRQLQYGNAGVRLEQGLAIFENRTPDGHLPDAIDVMLELSENVPISFSAEQPPILLRFSVQQNRVYTFAVAESSHALPSAIQPLENVVILLSQEERPVNLPIGNQQIFAIRQEDGAYRFFAQK